MSNSNPYQAPEAQIQVVAESEGELASRSNRFWAAIIDSLLGLVVAVPMMFVFGIFETMMAGKEASFAATAGYVLTTFVGYLLLHGYLLHTNGQTVGKKLLGIKIVNMQGAHPGLARIYLLRFLPTALVAMIPGIGGLIAMVDVLLIFKYDRRCGHDMIAGTQVVNA